MESSRVYAWSDCDCGHTQSPPGLAQWIGGLLYCARCVKQMNEAKTPPTIQERFPDAFDLDGHDTPF